LFVLLIAGVDFFETYAGAVLYESLRMLWAIAVEESRLVHVGHGRHERILDYGFMQSGRNWAEHLNASLGALGWVHSRADPAIRIRTTSTGTSIISVYTDDIDGISTIKAAAEDAQAGIKATNDVNELPRTATSLGMYGKQEHHARLMAGAYPIG
jgi:hypothetical protein